MAPYPETSGYIIPTLLQLDHEGFLVNARQQAEIVARWLVTLQSEDGGFSARELGRSGPVDVFDTGMILLGMTALLHEGEIGELEVPARRAADFLFASIDSSGCFVRHVSYNTPHAYNVRAAWALSSYGKIRSDSRLVEAGMANARWTVGQQNDVGFFHNNNFKPGHPTNTHAIAYVIQGLLRICYLSGDQSLLRSAMCCADQIARQFSKEKWLPSELSDDWGFLSRHVCLTGYAQLALVFFELFQLTHLGSYKTTAEEFLDQVARAQQLCDPSAPYHGAIAGSFPIYGRYAPFLYPNWATKFFIDALLTRRHILARPAGRDLLMPYGA
jgi:hypothetical protein